MNEITDFLFDYDYVCVCQFVIADSNMGSRKGANLCKIQVTSSINPFNIGEN